MLKSLVRVLWNLNGDNLQLQFFAFFVKNKFKAPHNMVRSPNTLRGDLVTKRLRYQVITVVPLSYGHGSLYLYLNFGNDHAVY